jgi:hypothetical protein
MNDTVDVVLAARASMLRMSRNWHEMGKLSQAVDAYLRVVRDYPATDEAEGAKKSLLEIAQSFEADGRYRLAIDILDRVTEAVG